MWTADKKERFPSRAMIPVVLEFEGSGSRTPSMQPSAWFATDWMQEQLVGTSTRGSDPKTEIVSMHCRLTRDVRVPAQTTRWCCPRGATAKQIKKSQASSDPERQLGAAAKRQCGGGKPRAMKEPAGRSEGILPGLPARTSESSSSPI